MSNDIKVRIKSEYTCDQMYCRNHKISFVDDLRQIAVAMNSSEKMLKEQTFTIDIIPFRQIELNKKAMWLHKLHREIIRRI